MSQEFPISQTRAFRTLATPFGGRHGTVIQDDASVRIRFGVMFRAGVPLSAVRGWWVSLTPGRTLACRQRRLL